MYTGVWTEKRRWGKGSGMRGWGRGWGSENTSGQGSGWGKRKGLGKWVGMRKGPGHGFGKRKESGERKDWEEVRGRDQGSSCGQPSCAQVWTSGATITPTGHYTTCVYCATLLAHKVLGWILS